eukprot:COSAG06_NODE_19998_length_814_cov_0.643357_1_plen_232_part_01
MFDDRNQTGAANLRPPMQQRGGRFGPLYSEQSDMLGWNAAVWNAPDSGIYSLSAHGNVYSITVARVPAGDGVWDSASNSPPIVVESIGECAEHCEARGPGTYYGVTGWTQVNSIATDCSADHCNGCEDEQSCLQAAGCSFWLPDSPGARCWDVLPCAAGGRHAACRQPSRRGGTETDDNCCTSCEGSSCRSGFYHAGQLKHIATMFLGFDQNCDDRWNVCGNTCCIPEDELQ